MHCNIKFYSLIISPFGTKSFELPNIRLSNLKPPSVPLNGRHSGNPTWLRSFDAARLLNSVASLFCN